MKPPGDAPKSPLDRDIADAFAALDATAPELPFDDFAGRVLARLDAGDNGQREAPPLGPNDSGLHDIVALASNARRRFAERGGSEVDGDDSAVILTAAQGGLRAVAVPDPSKGKSAGLAAPARQETAGEAARRADARSSAPFWILGSVASLAAAAAVAVFVFGIGRRELGQDSSDEAQPVAVLAEKGASKEQAAGGAPASAPAAASETAASSETARAEEPAEVVTDENAPRFATPPAGAPAKPRSRRAARARSGEAEGEEGAAKSEPENVLSADVRKPAVPPGEDGILYDSSAMDGGNKGVSLSDMIDEAAGKKKPSEAEVEEQKKEKAQQEARKELDRRDVVKALEAIRGPVQECAELEGARGSVTVKFVVAPTGEVTSASPTGAHARTRTGKCVAGLVKQARFSAFDGAPVSLTYPFRLAP